jgi:KDO2-lipid IV(A) lauroyltransferase
MYYVVFGFFYLLSLLPLKVLYLLSDFFYGLVFYVVGYRKGVVLQNLAKAFPEKTERERIRIAKNFYRNFTDTFIETVKCISVSQAWLRRHIKSDLQVFHQLHAQGYKCQVHMGHNFNWEMANLSLTLDLPYTLLGVYMPLTNKVMDRLFRYIRSKSGTVLVPATDMRTAMLPYRNTQYLLGLVADQNPGNPLAAYWVRFFGQATPFVKGPEKGARNAKAAVVFCHITKIRRGYYEVHFNLATAEPQALPEGELTRQYVHFLEDVIRAAPDMWLWSHRRWKLQWKPEYGPVLE